MEPITTIVSFLQEIWSVLAALAASIGTFYLGYRRFKREEKQNVDTRLDKLYAEIKVEAENCRNENTRLLEKMTDIQKQQTELVVQYTQLKTKWETLLGIEHKDITIERLIEFRYRQKQLASTLEEFMTTFPGLIWMKAVERDSNGKVLNFRMAALSQKYADLFLDGDRNTYIGKIDAEVWGNEIAEQFRKSSLRAYSSRNPIHVIEKIELPKKGLFSMWKWSISVDGMDYVCGYGDFFEAGTSEYDFWDNQKK